MTVDIRIGDCRQLLAAMPDESVHCVVTSPPYFGLRDYGVDGQIGLEPTPDAFVAEMVAVFREVRRVLRADGVLWLNLGDSYAANRTYQVSQSKHQTHDYGESNATRVPDGLKPKDLIGIPWRVAFALQADGWYLRQDIIWSKPNPMPESVTDRCTKAHEYLFLLSKSARYHYDADAIKEDCAWDASDTKFPDGWDTGEGGHGTIHRQGREKGKKNKRPELARGFRGGAYINDATFDNDNGGNRTAVGNDYAPEGFKRNRRSVWTVATQPFSEAHFATFPPDLIEPCIKAGCPKGGVVLDCFGGAGTTGLVADRLGRNAILLELNPTYAEMARRRISNDAGMFAEVAAQ
jgi:DNA modification methylase